MSSLEEPIGEIPNESVEGKNQFYDRLWTKQLDEGVHAATGVVSSAIAFRYQKLAIGMEELKKFHEKVPDAVKHERSWENITQRRGIPLLPRIDKALRQTARRHGDGAEHLHPSYVLRSWIGILAPRLEKSPADDKEDRGDSVYGNHRAQNGGHCYSRPIWKTGHDDREGV